MIICCFLQVCDFRQHWPLTFGTANLTHLLHLLWGTFVFFFFFLCLFWVMSMWWWIHRVKLVVQPISRLAAQMCRCVVNSRHICLLLLSKTVVNCNVASASVTLHTFSFMVLYKFVFNFNLEHHTGSYSRSSEMKTVIKKNVFNFFLAFLLLIFYWMLSVVN